MKTFNGIPMKSGVNDCANNIDGKCQIIECGGPEVNCTFTQIGVWLCSFYAPFPLGFRPKLGRPVKCKHKRIGHKQICKGAVWQKCFDCGAVLDKNCFDPTVLEIKK